MNSGEQMLDGPGPEHAEQRLAEVEELSGIGSWEWEIATDTLHWSPQLRRIYGADKSRTTFEYDDFITSVHPDDRDEVSATVQRAFDTAAAFEVEHRIVHPDGSVREIHSRGSVEVGEDGQPLRMLGAAQDITQARAAEAARAAERERRAAGQARDEALALLAHDLRSPLAVVVGYVQLMARQARDGKLDMDRALGYIGRIEESARQMTALLEDLLADAEPEAGAEPLETEPTDLGELIRRIASHHEGLGGASQIVVSAPEGPTFVAVNRARLERAVHNLLSNAIKYGRDGGRVEITLVGADDEARICVADDGIGIPAADLPYIFERFHRASNVTGRVGGIGLGLTSVKRAAELHGGSVEVHSVEGEGTTFTIRLPRR